MTSEIIATLVAGLGSGFGGWLYGRRSQRIANESAEIDNVEKVAKIWRELSADLRKEIGELRTELSEVKSENKELKEENASLKKQVKTLNGRLDKFIKKYGEE